MPCTCSYACQVRRSQVWDAEVGCLQGSTVSNCEITCHCPGIWGPKTSAESVTWLISKTMGWLQVPNLSFERLCNTTDSESRPLTRVYARDGIGQRGESMEVRGKPAIEGYEQQTGSDMKSSNLSGKWVKWIWAYHGDNKYTQVSHSNSQLVGHRRGLKLLSIVILRCSVLYICTYDTEPTEMKQADVWMQCAFPVLHNAHKTSVSQLFSDHSVDQGISV